MQFPSRRKSESYAETSPRIQADSRIMAPEKGEVEPLFPTASRRLADDSQLSKPRDSQQVHSRTLETTAETCRPLSSEGGLHLPQTTEQPLSAQTLFYPEPLPTSVYKDPSHLLRSSLGLLRCPVTSAHRKQKQEGHLSAGMQGQPEQQAGLLTKYEWPRR